MNNNDWKRVVFTAEFGEGAHHSVLLTSTHRGMNRNSFFWLVVVLCLTAVLTCAVMLLA